MFNKYNNLKMFPRKFFHKNRLCRTGNRIRKISTKVITVQFEKEVWAWTSFFASEREYACWKSHL